MRIGIFGGSFDPVHYGHLLMAEHAREQLRLDEVRFLPAATAPHKQHREIASAENRVEMLKLAIAGHVPFTVDTREIDRGGLSYTVDTLRELHDDDASRELFLLLGGDSLADLPGWREPEQICRLSTPAAIARVGFERLAFEALEPLVEPERMEAIKNCVVQMPLIELSSTEIRRRVGAGESIRFQTPRAVEQYVLSQELYAS
ncbi:MAG: nicotinate-nucleotide adenylyltransferase [Pirellulales bacterium]